MKLSLIGVSKMRSFVSFDFSKENREKIAEVQSIIRKNSKYGRFKYIGNFHLTLKFLGEVEEELLKSIGEDIEKEISGETPFSINIKGIDGFGIGDTIKTIYIKIEENKDRLSSIAKKIDDVCKEYGFKPEKSYTPHITIAQEVKLIVPFNKLKEELNLEFCRDILFDRLSIIKSEQIENKRLYTPIKIICFV